MSAMVSGSESASDVSCGSKGDIPAPLVHFRFTPESRHWRVDTYERSSIELIGRGVGIFATHLELFESLDKCGAGTVDIGVIVYKRVTFDREGKVIAEKPQLQILTSWDRLRQVLLKANDRQRNYFGHVFERVEQDGSSVNVHFANGRNERADLVVGCDGFRSSVRAALALKCSRSIPTILFVEDEQPACEIVKKLTRINARMKYCRSIK